MLTLFTAPTCIDSIKAQKWLEKSRIPYIKRNYFADAVTMDELKQMLSLTECGVVDIIAPEYRSLVKGNVESEQLSLSEVLDYIHQEPRLLNHPLIMDDKRLMIGYNQNEMDKFIPREIESVEGWEL